MDGGGQGVNEGDAQQSLAADGAIACFSSSLFLPHLNADRAPQLKTVVRSPENRKCVAKEKSQNGTMSVGSDLSLLQKEVTLYSFTSRQSPAVIAGRV